MLALSILLIIGLFTSLYGVLGAADFGAGFWDLFAGGAKRGAPTRKLIERVIGPVWEANHVWLVFILVFAWTAFPEPYAAVASTLYIPLSLAGLGIVLRGAGFMFRKSAPNTASARRFGAAFAISSVLTPFFLGTVAGAVASGRVPMGNAAGDIWSSWLTPTSLLGGVLAVGSSALLAAVLLTREAAIREDQTMTDYFRRRALLAGVILGGFALAGLPVLQSDAPRLFAQLTTGLGLFFVSLSAAAGLLTLVLLARKRYVFVRGPVVVATLALLWGWGASQYPELLPGVFIDDAAAPSTVLWALVIIFAGAALITLPALGFLFVLASRGQLDAGSETSKESTEELLASLSREKSV